GRTQSTFCNRRSPAPSPEVFPSWPSSFADLPSRSAKEVRNVFLPGCSSASEWQSLSFTFWLVCFAPDGLAMMLPAYQRRINPVQRSLSRPLTILGADRKLFFFAMCLGAA